MRSPSPAVQDATWALVPHLHAPELTRRAMRDAVDIELAIPRRVTAIRAFEGGSIGSAGPVLRKILDSHPGPEIQTAIVGCVASFQGPDVAQMLLIYFNGFSPEARKRAVEVLASHRE